ncbi:MAG: response regulator [Bacteroidetes bacterium]|nr:response regulator [Bacteroidota bacterium]
MSFSRPKKIFLVDDDTSITEKLKEFLTNDTGHTIMVFDSGEAALHAIHEMPDVVILAYYLGHHMKGAMNGLHAMEEMRKHHSNSHFIMLSGQDSYGVALESLAKGAEQYILKDEDAFANIAAFVDSIP